MSREIEDAAAVVAELADIQPSVSPAQRPAAVALFDSPLVALADQREQAAEKIVVGNCPRCGNQQARSDPGLVHCSCGAWVELRV